MKTGDRKPDFIIGGAMKSGTSTLHQILAAHPSIYLPQRETAFFDLDDIDTHPDFYIFDGLNWNAMDFDSHFPELEAWYVQQFACAQQTQLIGEDSPGYLMSQIAAERIARHLPTVKLIVLLRNPADRTYSHYWHMFRTGREYYSFEDSLMITPESKFRRSRYKEQLERYLRYFPRDQLFVASFERFIAQPSQVVNEILEFLGLGAESSKELSPVHANPAKMPRLLWLRRCENRLFRRYVTRLYAKGRGPTATPCIVRDSNWSESCILNAFKSVFRLINPQSVRKPPPMRAETRKFLNDYFRKQNRGLSELVGIELERDWYK